MLSGILTSKTEGQDWALFRGGIDWYHRWLPRNHTIYTCNSAQQNIVFSWSNFEWKIIYTCIFCLEDSFRTLAPLAVSPLGKTTWCDPGMLQIMFSPHSKEQAALATQTISTEKNVCKAHCTWLPRKNYRQLRVKDGENGRKKTKQNREHFVKLTLRNENHVIMLTVSRRTHTDHILIQLQTQGWGFTS